MTIDDLYGLPDDGRKYELQRGLLVSGPGAILAPRVLGRDDEIDGEDVVPGFRVDVAQLFDS